MLRLIAQISLVIGPLALLVFFQIQFLPYHPPWGVELWQRIAVVIDLALLWMLWPSISRGRVTWILRRSLRRGIVVPVALVRLVSALLSRNRSSDNTRRARRLLVRVAPRAAVAGAAMASAIPILLVFAVSTVPDEWLDQELHSTPVIRGVHKLLFAGEPNEVTGRPSSWFSNRLVLTDQTLVDADRLEKEEVSHSFRGRDLNYAVLSRADLRKADFTGAKLNNAVIRQARLQDAQFRCADTGRGEAFGCTQLQGADLADAQLQGASLDFAQLQGANLQDAKLQGALFYGVKVWRIRGERTSHSVIAWLPHLDLTDLPELDPDALEFDPDTKPWTDEDDGPYRFTRGDPLTYQAPCVVTCWNSCGWKEARE